MLGSRSEPMQSSIAACSIGQRAEHSHHRGVEPVSAFLLDVMYVVLEA